MRRLANENLGLLKRLINADQIIRVVKMKHGVTVVMFKTKPVELEGITPRTCDIRLATIVDERLISDHIVKGRLNSDDL